MRRKGIILTRYLTRPFQGHRGFNSYQDNSEQRMTSIPEESSFPCPFLVTENTKSKDSSPRHDLGEKQGRNITPVIKPFHSIPGPRGLPVVGTLFDYMKKDGLRFVKLFEAYRIRALQHGPIYKETIANQSTVVVSDPAEYNKIVRTEGRYPTRSVMEPWFYYREQKKLGQGLVNSNGAEWYKLRTVSAKKMLKMKEVLDFCTDMDNVASDFTIHLSNIKNDQNEVLGIEKEIFKWAMESMGTFLFDSRIGLLGENPPKQSKDFIENLQGFFRLMQPLTYNFPLYKIFPTTEWRQFQSHADNVFRIGRSFVDKITSQNSEKPQRGVKSSFVHHIRCQESLTENEALSTVVDLLVGATETTSNACLWVLYCLARHPEVQDKLYEETKRVLPNKETITPDKLSQLQYVKAVLKETLRMYPITFATSRFIEKDMEMAGYNLPLGTHVQCNLYGIYLDDKYFAEPMAFRPERWLKENKMDKEVKALSNLVWGHGARMCIGRRLAEQEIHILVTKIVQEFRLEYNHEPVGAVVRTVMTPDRPLRISFVPRT